MRSLRGGLRVFCLAVSWRPPVLGMPLLIRLYSRSTFLPSAQLAATASMFIEFEEARSHDTPVIGAICGIH